MTPGQWPLRRRTEAEQPPGQQHHWWAGGAGGPGRAASLDRTSAPRRQRPLWSRGFTFNLSWQGWVESG